jgi:hypothetical protein
VLLLSLDQRHDFSFIYHKDKYLFMNRKELYFSRLGGVMVSVLAIGPKLAGSNPVEAMDF